MTEFTKIVVVGGTRRATLVVPADEALGTHLPEIARILDQPPAAGVLTTAIGEALDLAASPTDQGLLDGTVLRLLPPDRVPAPPEVTDVTDRVAELRDTAPGRWTATHRILAGAIVAALLGATAGGALAQTGIPGLTAALYGAAVVAATVAGMLRRPAVAALLLGLALGATIPAAAWTSGVMLGDTGLATALAAVPVLAVGGAWLAIGAALGIGRRMPAAGLAATLGILLTAVAIVPIALGLSPVAAAAIVALLAVVALALLPGLAVATSGLASLDDAVIAGRLPDGERVAAGLHEAFRVSGGGALAVAVAAGPATALLVASGDVWALLLGLAVALVVLLRMRVMPTALPAGALVLAGAAGPLVGLWLLPGVEPWVRLTVSAVALVAVGLLALVQPSAQTRVRLRRAGDLVETLAAVAVVPLLLGVFGVYAFLVEVLA